MRKSTVFIWSIALLGSALDSGALAQEPSPSDGLETSPEEGEVVATESSEAPTPPDTAGSDEEADEVTAEGRAAAPDGTEADAETEEEEDGEVHAFYFGSYGRVAVASNLDGGVGRDADFTSANPRIDEDVYAEIELRRRDDFGPFQTLVVTTLAFGGPLFHFDGDFDERLAIRNLYAEARHESGTAIWAGSRMVRGDDIYLLNFWPLDNLNLVGGGVSHRLDRWADFRLHFGWAQPNDPFHRQVIDDVSPTGFVPEPVAVLDRPRLVVAARATAFPLTTDRDHGVKVVAYGEGHFLAGGQRATEDTGGAENSFENLPADRGYVLGGQIGGWIEEFNGFANIFVRYAHGLAAYDPLGVPFSEGAVIDTGRAQEWRIGVSANIEWNMLGLQLGGYYRNFRDADPNLFARGRAVEGVAIARPHVFIGEYFGVAADISLQSLAMSALDETTGQDMRGRIFKFGLFPYVSPLGRGTFTRPQIRLIYAMTRRNAGARRFYPTLDRRSQDAVEHFLGIGAEWWFDSSSYDL